MIKVLIVEDDPSLQNLYQKILHAINIEVVGIANNGEEAILQYKMFSEKPDIILMDHRMPIKNGIEATKEIIKLDQGVKIIFASADITVKEEAISVGACSFLEKPFSIKNIREEIMRVTSKELSIN